MNKLLSFILASFLVSSSFAQDTTLPNLPSGDKWVNLGQVVPGFGDVYAYGYTVADGGTAGAGSTTAVSFQLADGVSAEQFLAANGRLPPSNVEGKYEGPFNFTITSAAGNYQVSGNTVADLRASLAMCPSDICTSTSLNTNSPNYFYSSGTGSGNAGYFARISPSSLVDVSQVFQRQSANHPYKPYYELKFSAGGIFRFDVSSVSCPAGYSYNSTSGKCDLTDISSASVSVGDGVCMVYAGLPVVGDPDCQALKDSNKLTTSTTSAGQPAVSVASKSGYTVSQVYDPPTKASVVSRVAALPDGSTNRQDVNVSPTGAIGSSTTTNYPANPPPLYPGDPGGTTVPGSTTGTTKTAVPCGAPGEPKCAIDGMAELNGSASAMARDLGMIRSDISKMAGNGTSPTDDLGDALPAEISDPLGALEESASVIPVSSYCPRDLFSLTLPFPSHMGGPLDLNTDGLFCDLIGDYQELIRTLSIACAFVSATFIVLRA